MEGIVGFERLKLTCIIGAEPHERLVKQEVYVDLKVKTDFFPAALSDDIKQALDYTELAHLCERVAENQYMLLETYAYTVLQEILSRYKASWAWIAVRKPSALPNAACSLIVLEEGTWAGH